MPIREFHLAPLGRVIAASLQWSAVTFAIQQLPAPVPVIPGGLEVGSESIKFATGNLQVANQTSVLKQSTTGLTNVLRASNDYLLVRAYIDFDRMNRNNVFELLGNGSAGSQTGAMDLAFLPLALNSGFGTRRQKFELYTRQAGGVLPSYTLAGGTMPEVSGWYDIVIRRSGDVTKIDVYDMAGTKVSDGAASALTQANFGVNTFVQSHFYIGDAVDVASEPTTSTARGIDNNTRSGWEGAIAFVGWGNAAVSDADCQAIALGADPLTRIGASNFTFYRRFRDTSLASRSPVAGTSDTSAATTVIGAFLPGGTPGRQSTSNYITLNAVPDYYGWGVNPVTLESAVLFEGTCGGVAFSGTITEALLPTFEYRREVRFISGVIQGRFIAENGTPVSAWQQVATTTATGITEGLTFTENSRSAPSIKVLISGQSQMDSFAKGTSLNNTMTTPSVSLVRIDNAAFNPGVAVKFQTYAEVGNNRAADGVAQMAKVIQAAAPGGVAAVTAVFNAVDGTGVSAMLDDWIRGNLNTVSLLAYSGNDITIDLFNWHSTDAGQGSNFGANVLGGVYLGTGSLATANQLPDIRRADAKIVVAVATRETTISAGPFDTDQSTGIGLVRQSARAWAAANGAFIAPEQIDMKLAASNGPHQDQASVRGNPRIFGRMGEGINRALGFSTSVDPTIGTPQFNVGKASFRLTVTLPNAGSTLRVDNTATYGSNVQGFEISTDGGSTWSRSGFTATFSGTTVTLTKSSGDWTAVATGQMQVRYAWGGPFSYGTSLESAEQFRGLLYDGTALESNLGLPVSPLAAAVVAQP